MAGFHSSRTLGKVGSNKGKSDLSSRSAGTSPLCPECGSAKVWKDGIRSTHLGLVQRWICRSCGYRFSEKSPQTNFNHSDMSEHVERILTKTVFRTTNKHNPCRVSDDPAGRASGASQVLKNLAEVETRIQERAAGATKPDRARMKGLLMEYRFYLQKEGYAEDSRYADCIRMLINAGTDLLDPENVKVIIAKRPWKDGVKMQATYAYDLLTKMVGLTWTKPKYTQEETLPFVPDERELDQLIASCKSRRMATYLQTLKETYADPTEALRLRWIDVDSSKNIITINQPVKGHLPGQIKVSNKLLAMLNALPKTSERVFPMTYRDAYGCFRQVRKRAAERLQNPRLMAISFKTFRHWGGSMIAHYTNGNVLTVKKLLRHKRIDNTMKYIHMIQFKDDEFDVTTATTVEEAKKVLESGFDYVTEKDGIMLFRRPRKFNT